LGFVKGKMYGNYEALLEGDEVDAMNIPLPIHLHVGGRQSNTGKYVLCAKRIGQLLPRLLNCYKQEKPGHRSNDAF
jgi:hypothetical protein